VDGGHRFGPGGKADFRSSATSIAPPAPVLFQRELPEAWRWVCILPPGRSVSGAQEDGIFATHCPMPLDEVRELAHLVLMRAMPAVVEVDVAALGAALTRMQDLGFKRVEVDLQPPHVRGLMRVLVESGAAGAGMSSFGPLVFGLCRKRDADDVRTAGEEYLRARGVKFDSFLSATDYGGSRIEAN